MKKLPITELRDLYSKKSNRVFIIIVSFLILFGIFLIPSVSADLEVRGTLQPKGNPESVFFERKEITSISSQPGIALSFYNTPNVWNYVSDNMTTGTHCQ